MSHVFVSHATADDKIVSKIHDVLEAAGIPAWVDHENKLKPGGNWNRGIQTGLNECRAGLFVLSFKSAKSEECEAEYRRILALGKILYVALIEPVSKADFPWRLTTIQYVNLQTDFNAGMADLIQAIEGERGLDPSSPTTGQANPVSGAFPRWHLDVPLIGRDVEFAETLKSLNESSRATMVLGLGGIGKTRLAAEIVSKTEFKDGVVWQTIAPHTSLTDLTLLIRDHLGLPPTSEADTIWRELGKKAVLIVLDNAEDCSMPAAYAERINALDLSGGTRVLLTSRKLWNEIRRPKLVELHSPSLDSAVSILRAMTEKEPPAYTLAGYEERLAEAARQHPRLMEFAVSWLRTYPPDYVLTNILQPLKGKDAEEALANIILKTVEQVKTEPDGQEAITSLQRLAVCRGGFTFDAAQVLTANPRMLVTLRNWNLIGFEGQRYSLDPLVIAAVGEDLDAHRPHYDYYLRLAVQHDKKQDYLGLDIESANLEAAFEWAMATGDDVDALNLANACGQFMLNRGRFAQILEWHERIVKSLADHPDKMLWANAQNSLGLDYQSNPLGNKRENLKRSISAFKATLEYITPQTAPQSYALTQNNLGNAYQNLAQIEEREANLKRAIAAYEAALVYRTPQTAPLDYAMTQNNLGNTYRDLAAIEEREANLKRAIAAFEAALVYRTPQAAPLGYALTQENVGLVYWDLAKTEDKKKNLAQAVTAYKEALRFLTSQAAPYNYPKVQRHLGMAYEDMGDLPTAIDCWREAEHYYRQMGYVAEADKMLAWIADAEAELRGGS